MCKLKSGIILKDRVFMPDYDSHTDMLEELKIDDTRDNASRLFVRAELYPKNGDVFSDIDTWIFNVDQDILPEWFVADYEKNRMIEAVKKWAETHIHIGKDNLTINDGKNHYIKDCKNVNIRDNATVKNICDNATVKYIRDNATVEYIYDNATVKNICDNATVEYIYGNATVEYIYGNATVEYIYGNATVEKSAGFATIITSKNYKWYNLESTILLENSTIKDNYGKVVYQSGDVKLVTVTNGKIEEV